MVLHSLGLGVALVGRFQHALSGLYLRFGWLQDRVALGVSYSPGWAFVFPVWIFGWDHDVLAGF